LLFIFSIKERKNISLLFILIIISGIITWFLGYKNNIVIGDASFIFLIFTYMFMQILFTKNVLYLLITLFFGFPYISSFFNHFFLDLYHQNSFVSKIIVLSSDLIKNLL
jgi:multisubunit Na+/H+ antiporter MnhB subunit